MSQIGGAQGPTQSTSGRSPQREEQAAMCLGIPGEVIEVRRDPALGLVHGRVRFGGIVKEINLTFTPDVEPGAFVIVHVGFSISTIAPEEADQVFRELSRLGELSELAAAGDES